VLPPNRDTRLVTIVRKSGGSTEDGQLAAVVSDSTDHSLPNWTLNEVPVEALSPPLAREAEPVARAWAKLQRVRVVSPETLAGYLTILLATVPDLRSKSRRTQVSVTAEPERPRATAAHPRAFRGTKYKPPKAAKTSPVDLRVELFARGAIGRRLAESRAVIEPALDLLARRGFAAERLTRIAAGGDPYLAYHHGANVAANVDDFSTDFVRLLLPALRGGAVGMDLVVAWASQWSTAGPDESFRGALTRLALLSPEQGLKLAPLWMGAAERQRTLTVRTVLAFGVPLIVSAFTHEQWASHAESFHRSLHGASDDVYADRLAYLLRTVAEGAPVDYALDWIGVSGTGSDRTAPCEVGLDSSARWNDVEDLAARADDKPWFSSWLFGMCGRLPGLARWIRETNWNRLSPATAITIVERVANLAWDDLPPERLQAKWTLIREELPRLIDWLFAEIAESHRESAFVLMIEFLSCWRRDVPALKARLPTAYALVGRIALPPFRPDACNDWLIAPLVRGMHEQPDALRWFLNAPERCFRVMDRAVRRENDALLVGRGFGILLRYLLDFTVDSFVAYPTQVMALSRTLGALDYDEGCARAREFGGHPLIGLRDRLSAIPADRVPLRDQAKTYVEQLGAYLGPRTPNPVPRRLTEYVRGEAELRDTQVVRHLRRVRAQLDSLVLAALESSVIEPMGASMRLDSSASDAARHALLLERSADENRRALRRLLKAVGTGDSGYLERHPATLAYRKAHPSLDDKRWAIWLAGLTLDASALGKSVRMGIERDTLEVLRLGTYASTCLGLGGGHIYSAAAVALDLNKRVVYARSEGGGVLARQLLALSDDDRLVCFHVYPLSTTPVIQELFARYDRKLARALGLPLYTETEGSCDEAPIAGILSRGFWHDGAWDLQPRVGGTA
jgi:hypothetical protein